MNNPKNLEEALANVPAESVIEFTKQFREFYEELVNKRKLEAYKNWLFNNFSKN